MVSYFVIDVCKYRPRLLTQQVNSLTFAWVEFFCLSKNSIDHFDNMILIGINTDITCNGQRFFHDFLRGQIRILQ